MYCPENVPLGTKGKGLWCHNVKCGVFCKFAPPECVFYVSLNLATGTPALSWPYKHAVGAEIDGKEPQVRVGQNDSSSAEPHREAGSACLSFPLGRFSLNLADHHLGPLVQGGNGSLLPTASSPLVRRLL